MTTQTINSNYPTSNTKKTIYCGGLAEEVDEKVSTFYYCTITNVLNSNYGIKLFVQESIKMFCCHFLGSKRGFYTLW